MATFNEYAFVKEILLKKEEGIITILEFLDPEEEIKVRYEHTPEAGYKISFASEIMFVADAQHYIPDATILSIW